MSFIPNKAVSIIGPRRSGKTWFLLHLMKELEVPALYVDFEDIAFRGIRAEKLFEVIRIFSEMRGKPEILLLDEVQYVDRWESLVRTLLDRGYRVLVTGSSSKLLSREITTQLREGQLPIYFYHSPSESF